MDLYHIWCDLKPGISDVTLVENAGKYLGHLKSNGRIEGWRLTRRKLGLGAAGLGEFHIIIETSDLAQLDQAFQQCLVAARAGRGPASRAEFAGAERDVRALPRFSRSAPPLRRREVLKGHP